MELTISALIDLIKVAGPSVGILVMVVILLYRMLNKRDNQLSVMATAINGNTKTLERLTTLIEVLVGSRRQ